MVSRLNSPDDARVLRLVWTWIHTRLAASDVERDAAGAFPHLNYYFDLVSVGHLYTVGETGKCFKAGIEEGAWRVEDMEVATRE